MQYGQKKIDAGRNIYEGECEGIKKDVKVLRRRECERDRGKGRRR